MGPEHEDRERANFEVLLVREVAVDGDERVEAPSMAASNGLSSRSPQPISVACRTSNPGMSRARRLGTQVSRSTRIERSVTVFHAAEV